MALGLTTTGSGWPHMIQCRRKILRGAEPCRGAAPTGQHGGRDRFAWLGADNIQPLTRMRRIIAESTTHSVSNQGKLASARIRSNCLSHLKACLGQLLCAGNAFNLGRLQCDRVRVNTRERRRVCKENKSWTSRAHQNTHRVGFEAVARYPGVRM